MNEEKCDACVQDEIAIKRERKAAVEAGARAEFIFDWPEDGPDIIGMPDDPGNFGGYRNTFRAGLTAAYPHIRRAVIEELIAKADEARDIQSYHASNWLRAELEEKE